MKRFLLLLLTASSLCAQTPDEPHEGTRLEYDAANGIYRFKWWGRAGRTYFLQHSEDLEQWNWLPVVEPGDDSVKEWGLTTTGSKFFMRLQYTDEPVADAENGDLDGDGVSNLAEVQQDTNPFSKADADGDGLSDDFEIWQGSDPHDFFNGQAPVLTIVEGTGQTGAPGGLAPKPLVVRLSNVGNASFANAPVTFTVSSGGGQVQKSNIAPFTSTLEVRTDSAGRAKVYFQFPQAAGNQSLITATSGTGGSVVSASFSVTSDNGSGQTSYRSPYAPSNIVATLNEDGSADVSWTNNTDPADTEPFPVKYRDEAGNWVTAGTVPAGSTSYHIPPQ